MPSMSEQKGAEGLLPGEDLVARGLEDLAADRMSELALLVLVASPSLRRLGIAIPTRELRAPCEHLLYAQLEDRLGAGAHSYYNSLIRRIVSFTHALEREKSSRQQAGERASD